MHNDDEQLDICIRRLQSIVNQHIFTRKNRPNKMSIGGNIMDIKDDH